MANIDSNLANWSGTAASNQPDATDTNTIVADLRQIQATVRNYLGIRATIASGTTVDLSTVVGLIASVTHGAGTTAISSFGTLSAGMWKIVTFAITGGTLTLTHSATQMILPGAANITIATGDSLIAESLGSGNWKVHIYQCAAALPITNSLIADVALNNSASYFDGPSVSQGTAGTWFVSATVTFYDTGALSAFRGKLWDGTTVIASAQSQVSNTTTALTMTLSGYITSPAGDLRLSLRDVTANTGVMAFNLSGSSKDSTITAIRIA